MIMKINHTDNNQDCQNGFVFKLHYNLQLVFKSSLKYFSEKKYNVLPCIR
jgi:hypothetical protein